MTLNKAVKKTPKPEPLGIEESNSALKWLLGIAAKDTPSGAEASKVVKLIKNMSSVLQRMMMEEFKAASGDLELVLAEVSKFPPDSAETGLGAKLFDLSLLLAEFRKDTSLRLPFSTRRFKTDSKALYYSTKKQIVASKRLLVRSNRRNPLQFPVAQVPVT